VANLFNSANAPTDEPLEFVKGDFVQWRQDETDAFEHVSQ